jgi:competence protein ComEC
LAWLTEGARLFARLPYAAVQLPPFPLWLLLAYYAIVVGGWLWNAAFPEGWRVAEIRNPSSLTNVVIDS